MARKRKAKVAKRRGRGEGCVEHLPSGKFRAILALTPGPAGKRRRLTGVFSTKRAALTWLRARQSEQAQGSLPDSSDYTVATWLDRWLAMKKGKVDPKTWLPYEQHCRLHIKPRIGTKPLVKLSALDVEGLYVAMKEAGEPASKQRKVGGTLRSAFNDAVRLGLLHRNVATAVRLPASAAKRMQVLDADQARRLLEAVRGDRLEGVYHLSLDAGLRQGEILGLHWSEVDLKKGLVTVVQSLQEGAATFRLKEPKSAAGRRRVPITKETAAVLTAHKQALKAEGRDVVSGPVFVTVDGGWVTKSSFLSSSFRPLLKRARLPRIRPHDQRHTSATLLLQAGVSVKVVSERLGHADIALTLRTYTHVLPDMQEGAVALMSKILSGDSSTAVPRPGDDWVI
jgi:integrase